MDGLSRALDGIRRRIVADDGVEELLAFPFAPGDSPFRLKGVAYRGHLEYVARHVPGGTAAANAQLTDPRMRTFLEDTTFLASSLYDVVPLAVAGLACGKATGMGFLEFVQKRTVKQVEFDTDGVYRNLLTLVSPQAVIGRMPQLVGQYTNFARTKLEWQKGNVIVSRHEKIPRALAPWWVTVTDTYVRVVLHRVGIRTVDITYDKPVPAGSAHGVPLVDVTMTGILE